MSERFDELTARHQQLRQQTALQRGRLAESTSEIRQRLDRVDRGVNIVRRLARNPLVIVGGVAVVALLGPRRLLRWTSSSALFVATARRLFQR